MNRQHTVGVRGRWSASLRAAIAQADGFAVRVREHAADRATDETIGIRWADVRTHIPTARAGHCPRLDPAPGDEVVSQVVDNDGDGTMDELIFQATFAPGESKRFIVESGAPGVKPAQARVYAVHRCRATTSRGRAIASRFASTARDSGRSIR